MMTRGDIGEISVEYNIIVIATSRECVRYLWRLNRISQLFIIARTSSSLDAYLLRVIG